MNSKLNTPLPEPALPPMFRYTSLVPDTSMWAGNCGVRGKTATKHASRDMATSSGNILT